MRARAHISYNSLVVRSFELAIKYDEYFRSRFDKL